MRLTKFSLLAIVFALMLISSEILVVIKQSPSKGAKPDLQSMINQHPAGWQPIAGSSVDPNTQNSTYDLVVSQIYRRADGKAVSVVITWSLDGVQTVFAGQDTPRKSAIILKDFRSLRQRIVLLLSGVKSLM